MAVFVYSRSARSCEFASSRSYSKSSKLLGFDVRFSEVRYRSSHLSASRWRGGRPLEPVGVEVAEPRRVRERRGGRAVAVARLAKLGRASGGRGAGSRENLRWRSRWLLDMFPGKAVSPSLLVRPGRGLGLVVAPTAATSEASRSPPVRGSPSRSLPISTLCNRRLLCRRCRSCRTRLMIRSSSSSPRTSAWEKSSRRRLSWYWNGGHKLDRPRLKVLCLEVEPSR